MFGHGQVEGFTEKYGMEFRRATLDEKANQQLIERHYREIFPLMKKRFLFADVEQFFLYDLFREDGSVNENVFAYTNAIGSERALVLYNNCYEACWGSIKVSAGYVQKNSDIDRQLLQKGLAEALVLRNDENCYCLMREQRSGLWFIRRSSEIWRNGVQIVLNGYQSQVYMEIHEVFDNGYQHYRQLHDHLNGAGVVDVSEAIKDIVLGPIYKNFDNAFDSEFWKQVNLFSAIGDEQKSGKIQIKSAYHNFIAQTLRYSPNREIFQNSVHKFDAIIDNLDTLNQLFNKNDGIKIGKVKNAIEYGKYGLKLIEQKRGVIALIILYCISVENEEWALQHKIPGIGDFRYQLSTLLEVLKTVSSWQTSTLQVSDLAEALSYIELQEFLLVNYYDGIRWFNKERFESLAWWLFMWKALSSEKPIVNPEELVISYERSMKWLDAQVKSEFKLDVLKKTVQKSVRKIK